MFFIRKWVIFFRLWVGNCMFLLKFRGIKELCIFIVLVVDFEDKKVLCFKWDNLKLFICKFREKIKFLIVEKISLLVR